MAVAVMRPPAPSVQEGYASARDGTSLFFRVEGTGPRTLFCLNGVGVSTFFWDPTVAYFRERYRVVVFDYRAHGKSGPGPSPDLCSVRTCAEDAVSVMDHLGIDKAVLLGHSMGVQVSLELYSLAPGRVLAMVPTLGTYKSAVSTFLDSPRFSRLAMQISGAVSMRIPRVVSAATRAFVSSPLAWPTMKLLGFVHPDLCPREGMVPYLEHLGQLELRAYFTLLADIEKQDATEVLGTVRVPVLVVGGDRDLFTPVRLSRELHERIPGSQFFVIPHGSHAAIIEQPELYCLRVEKFLDEHVFAGRG